MMKMKQVKIYVIYLRFIKFIQIFSALKEVKDDLDKVNHMQYFYLGNKETSSINAKSLITFMKESSSKEPHTIDNTTYTGKFTK